MSLEEYFTFHFLVDGILLVAVGLLGVVGNIFCIVWFSRKLVQRAFHQLMLTLAVFDLLYVVISLILFGVPGLFPWVYDFVEFNHLISIILPFAQIGLTGSIYLTLAISIERYTTVCHPFFKLYHSWSAKFYIIPISMFSVLYNIPKFFEHRVIKNYTVVEEPGLEPVNITLINVEPTHLRRDPYYVKVYLIILNLVVHGIIPLLLLSILNITVYRQIRSMRRTNIIESSRGEFHSKEIRLSQISLVIVAVFLLCHAIRWIPNIWELRQSDQSDIDWPPWIQNITSLSHLLTVFSSSVNFYIYAYKQCNSPEENEILMDEVEPEFTQRSMMEVANVEVVLESKSQVATSRV